MSLDHSHFGEDSYTSAAENNGTTTPYSFVASSLVNSNKTRNVKGAAIASLNVNVLVRNIDEIKMLLLKRTSIS